MLNASPIIYNTDSPRQCLNFIWLPLKFAVPNQTYYDPIPPEYLQNAVKSGMNNPDVDVYLWVDSKRLTSRQLTFLEGNTSGNLTISNLRTIDGYSKEPLFQQEDETFNWRQNKHSLIWRQVDAARILICLHTLANYDQVFYADMDIVPLNVKSARIQSALFNHGIILAGNINQIGQVRHENQMFGFDSKQRGFFEILYSDTLRDATKDRPVNGHPALVHLIDREFKNIDLKSILYTPEFINIPSYHPASEHPQHAKQNPQARPWATAFKKIRELACPPL